MVEATLTKEDIQKMMVEILQRVNENTRQRLDEKNARTKIGKTLQTGKSDIVFQI